MTEVPQWPGPVVRRLSWDHLVHDFRQFGELTSVAVCTHIADNRSLEEPTESDRPCEACRMIRDAQQRFSRERAAQWPGAGWDIVANAPEPAEEPPSPHPGKNCGCRACRWLYGFEG